MSQVKKWQTKGGFAREDSDDELGYDDHPWQWIYQDSGHLQHDTAVVDNNNNDDDLNSRPSSSSRKRKASAISTDDDDDDDKDNDNDNDKTAVTPSKSPKPSLSTTKPKAKTKRTIVGAKMGTFHVHIGDAVFLKSPEQGKDWAGLICAFSETDEDGSDEKCAHIMWFCSPDEMGIETVTHGEEGTAALQSGENEGGGGEEEEEREGGGGEGQQRRGRRAGAGSGTAKKKKRKMLPTAVSNESYITADFNMNPLTAINGKATVLGKTQFEAKYPGFQCPAVLKNGRGKVAAVQFTKTIVCRRAVRQRGMVFSEEFEWEDVYNGPEDLLALVDHVKESTKRRGKSDVDRDYDAQRAKEDAMIRDESLDINDMGIPETPKKRKEKKQSSKLTGSTSSVATTPKSSVKSRKFITPTHKRIMVKKPLEITPLGTRILSPATYMASPYSQARTTLHVSAVPLSLPCRTTEFTTVYNHLRSAIDDGSGACIYISGTPGTGKTATVREVVASLHEAVQNDELDDFNFVEINGMKVTEPHQSYSLLWEALKGDRVSPANALHLLEHEFSHPNPRRIPCVVLMDELDQLVTKNQSVMYNFFNWPALRHSRLIVLAVANTMDLPERTLSNKISSRLGLTRITFPGYTHTQLMEIISSRLEGVPGSIVDADAVQFASRKVAAVSGDARRALDICRRAVEIAEQQANEQNRRNDATVVGDRFDASADEGDDTTTIQTPSKTGRGSTKKDKHNKVGPAAVEDDDATPKAKQNPEKPKAIPRVTISTIKQAINEATSSPIAQHLRSLPLASKLFLAALLARSRRTGISESTLDDVLVECKRIADVAENQAIHDFLLCDRIGMMAGEKKGRQMPRVLAMGAAAMGLVEAGIIALDARSRGQKAGKVRLRIGDEEVKSALMGDTEVRGMGFNA